MEKGWGGAAALACVGFAAAVASCATRQRDDVRDPVTGHAVQALDGTVSLFTTKKVCQLIGDRDFETRQPTKSLTGSRFGVDHTDLGYPVQSFNRVWFFFGDVSTNLDVDPLGFSDETPANGNCPLVQFTRPVTDARQQAVTLDGKFLEGFKVPTGVAFDPIGVRFIAVFMTGDTLPNHASTPENNHAVFAEASLGSPRDFHSIPGTPDDQAHFLLVAPWIVQDTDPSVSEIVKQLPSADPGSRHQVLLAWGAGWRNTSAFFGAVRLEQISTSVAWRFLSQSTDVPWSTDTKDLAELHDHRCVGEMSVTYEPTMKEWRMVYACTADQFREGDVALVASGGDPLRPIVVLRTADRPEGPWSKAKVLFLPRENGAPLTGDEGLGLFYHRSNLRVYEAPGSTTLQQLNGDGLHLEADNPPPYHCAASFPSYCVNNVVQDVTDPDVGCCTRSDRCCDIAFDQIQPTGNSPHYSWSDGAPYAPYLIQPWTQDVGTRVDPRFPSGQRLFWTLSTLNPYVVDLMSTDLLYRDLDNDGVPNDDDNYEVFARRRDVRSPRAEAAAQRAS